MKKDGTPQRLILLLMLLSTTTSKLFAQKATAAHWYFGDHYGLDFSNGYPETDFNNSMYTYEAATTMSDKNGDLLFYSNGGGRANQAICGHIWNRNHEVMEGGNMGYDQGGGYSAAQGVLSFKKPGTENKYYLFTVDEIETINGANNTLPEGKGARFFEIDMAANGGLGAVTLSNQLLFAPAFEYQAATIHANCEDYWLIVPTGHYILSDDPSAIDSFCVYLVNNNGPTLVHQFPIPEAQPDVPDEYGIIKISPDGKYMTCGTMLYNFDNSNGQITLMGNLQDLISLSTQNTLAFSPNGKLLYKFDVYEDSTFPLNSDSSTIFRIAQYDLTSANIGQSVETLVFTRLLDYAAVGKPQLAPDGKLYFIIQNGTFSSPSTIAVINHPNSIGLDAGVNLNLMELSNAPDTRLLNFGNFTDHLFYNEATLDIAENESVVLDCQFLVDQTFSAPPEMDCYYWSTGETTQSITTSEEGCYWVEYWNDCAIGADSFFLIYENELFDVELGSDTTLCGSEQIELTTPSFPNVEYLWNDGSTATTLAVSEAGLYHVLLQQDACLARDSIVITKKEIPSLDLGEDLELCISDSIRLNFYHPDWESYTWQNDSAQPYFDITESGTYELRIENSCGTATDDIIVSYYACDACPVYVPTAFSPDGNSNNDLFQVYSTCRFLDFQLQIFDRWGSQVFGSQQADAAWDGLLKGQLCQAGIYVYKLNFQWLDESNALRTEQLYGEVILMR